MAKRKCIRWSQSFKLEALRRMAEAADVSVLAEELGLGRGLLYNWRRKFLACGAEALQPSGRPSEAAKLQAMLSSDGRPTASAGGENRHVALLERKVAQQQLDLDFFQTALRHIRGERQTSGAPGATTSTQRSTR